MTNRFKSTTKGAMNTALQMEPSQLTEKPPLGKNRSHLKLVWENPGLSHGKHRGKSEVELKLVSGSTLYAYVGGNPVNWIDPTGEIAGKGLARNAINAVKNAVNSARGKRYPTKKNASGKNQPYDPKNGQYLPGNKNPGLGDSPAKNFCEGFGMGMVEGATGTPTNYTPTTPHGSMGFTMGQMVGSMGGWF